MEIPCTIYNQSKTGIWSTFWDVCSNLHSSGVALSEAFISWTLLDFMGLSHQIGKRPESAEPLERVMKEAIKIHLTGSRSASSPFGRPESYISESNFKSNFPLSEMLRESERERQGQKRLWKGNVWSVGSGVVAACAAIFDSVWKAYWHSRPGSKQISALQSFICQDWWIFS